MEGPVMLVMAAAVVVALFTSAGEVDVRVDTVHAPETAANFLAYVRHGAYTNGTFFRTVLTQPDNQPHIKTKIDVIQATNVASAKLARSKDHRGFAAFGQVVRGMDVVRAIHTSPHQKQQLTPVIRIRRAVIRP